MANSQKTKLFSQDDDETEAPIGEQIGEAIAVAMSGISESNEKMSLAIAKSIADALKKSETADNKAVKKWIFHVERNDKGLMTQVIATAEVA